MLCDFRTWVGIYIIDRARIAYRKENTGRRCATRSYITPKATTRMQIDGTKMYAVMP